MKKILPLVVLLAVVAVSIFPLMEATSQALTATETFTNPEEFREATMTLGTPTIIDFEDAEACPGDTIESCSPFDGEFYADKGITFSNPNGYPFFIAPAGLFWNENKSLSVGRFPFDPMYPKIYHEDDDLIIEFDSPSPAVGFSLIELGSPLPGECVEFKDSTGSVIESLDFPSMHYMPYRAFLGIVSEANPIAKIEIVEAPDDGDDVNYDNIIFFPQVPATIDIDPDTLNLRSKGRWITAYIELSEGYDVSEIDVSAIMLNDTIAVNSEAPTEIGDYDEDGILDLMVKSDRQEVIALLSVGEATLTITGEVNGIPFEGSDTIRVVGE